MIWFTSDTHFGHENVLKFTDRPWETILVVVVSEEPRLEVEPPVGVRREDEDREPVG